MTQGLVIPRPGGVPELREVAQPEAPTNRLTLVAAELLPLDLQVAKGALPSVTVDDLRAGQVAVARKSDGTLVSVIAGGIGAGLGAPWGTFATEFAAPPQVTAPLPAGLDPYLAAAGASSTLAARLALRAAECTQADTVLVVGASGAVGSAAVDLARAWGCQVIELRRNESITGAAPTVIIDCAAGPAMADVIRASAPRARHLVVGYTGDGVGTFSLPLLLLSEHRLLGFNVYLASPDEFAAGHRAALDDLAGGTVTVEFDRMRQVPLADAAQAYASGSRVLLVP